MIQLIFATNNQHKVNEIKTIIGNPFHVISLHDAGIDIDIQEPYDTLQENASEKSRVIYQLTNQNCFSEDTGLEVEALNGEPGVKSARYAGEEKHFQENINKLLKNLANIDNRKAQFRTVVSLILNGKEYIFEGICKGRIIEKEKGTSGFGYDPIFIPDGSNKTFAEMTIEEKNLYSHRKKAIQQLINFLSQNGNKLS
ncbi:MAG: RdgB/HAM1 family non-canonical purine NTP pyrophosphatase [Chitinophagaceae bacterium]|nr:RdgB/HAM1 family non-canonical purine NTP pyrophosphatase [Chitinophagaceae bacterium]MCW5905339.1 RdgB/HAM1 family non-canonical purine NTP pyrophosphatase [Chitinophagaceae bacterium]